jgi:hypothetical protein
MQNNNIKSHQTGQMSEIDTAGKQGMSNFCAQGSPRLLHKLPNLVTCCGLAGLQGCNFALQAARTPTLFTVSQRLAGADAENQ